LRGGKSTIKTWKKNIEQEYCQPDTADLILILLKYRHFYGLAALKSTSCPKKYNYNKVLNALSYPYLSPF
jgi:hypothetical protein